MSPASRDTKSRNYITQSNVASEKKRRGALPPRPPLENFSGKAFPTIYYISLYKKRQIRTVCLRLSKTNSANAEFVFSSLSNGKLLKVSETFLEKFPSGGQGGKPPCASPRLSSPRLINQALACLCKARSIFPSFQGAARAYRARLSRLPQAP